MTPEREMKVRALLREPVHHRPISLAEECFDAMIDARTRAERAEAQALADREAQADVVDSLARDIDTERERAEKAEAERDEARLGFAEARRLYKHDSDRADTAIRERDEATLALGALREAVTPAVADGRGTMAIVRARSALASSPSTLASAAIERVRRETIEECAKVCDRLAAEWDAEQGTGDELVDLDHGDRLRNAATVLRARAKQES